MNTRGLSFPEFRRFTVQSEQSGQAAVALVGTGGTVLLRGLGEGVQQTPPGRFGELLMPGMFECGSPRKLDNLNRCKMACKLTQERPFYEKILRQQIQESRSA